MSASIRKNHLGFPRWTAAVYLLAIVIAEGTLDLGFPSVALVLYSVLLLSLILQSVLASTRFVCTFLLSIALIPLMRLVALSLPLAPIPLVYWYLAVSVPMLIASFVLAKVLKVPRSEMGIKLGDVFSQMTVAVTGLGLGYIEYQIHQPSSPISGFPAWQLWVPSLILLFSTGFTEELVFRGIMQKAAMRSIGTLTGMLFVTVLYASLQLGQGSWTLFVFVLIAAGYFACVVAKTGSIVGVSISHGLSNIMYFLVLPRSDLNDLLLIFCIALALIAVLMILSVLRRMAGFSL